jgi:hypothetical protein
MFGSPNNVNGFSARHDQAGSQGTAQWLTGANIPFFTPYHVVGIFRSLTYRSLYVNGIYRAENTTSIPTEDTWDRLGIGTKGDITPANPFEGWIWDVRVYAGELNAGEIYRLYDPATRYDLYAPVAPPRFWSLPETSGSQTVEEAIALSYSQATDVRDNLTIGVQIEIEQLDSIELSEQSNFVEEFTLDKSLEVTIEVTADISESIDLQNSFSGEFLASGMVYEEAITLHYGLSCTTPWSAPTEDGTPVEEQQAIYFEEQLVATELVTLSRQESITAETQLDAQDTIDLSQEESIVLLDSISVEEGITLNRVESITTPQETVGETDEFIDLALSMFVETVSQIEAASTLDLLTQRELDLTDQLQAENIVDLDHTKDIVLLDSTTTEEEITLDHSESTSVQETVGEVDESISLAKANSLDLLSHAGADSTILMAVDLSLDLLGSAFVETVVSTEILESIALQETLGEYDEAITLSESRSLDLSTQLDAQNLLEIARENDISWTDQAEVFNGIEIEKVLQSSFEAFAWLDVSIDLSQVESIALLDELGTVTVEESITLACSLDTAYTSGLTGENALTLEHIQSLSLISQATSEDELELSFEVTTAVTSYTWVEVFIATEKFLQDAFVAEPMVFEESISLGVVASALAQSNIEAQSLISLERSTTISVVGGTPYEETLVFVYSGTIVCLEEHIQLGTLPRDILDLSFYINTSFATDLAIKQVVESDLSTKALVEMEFEL